MTVERRLMQGAGMRVVAVSNFTAGTLMQDSRATVLPPGPSRERFDTLAARTGRQDRDPGVRLATAFRLTEWQGEGLPQLIAAVSALRRPDVGLSICRSVPPPDDLLRLVREHPWCTLRPGLSDTKLARELSAADMFAVRRLL